MGKYVAGSFLVSSGDVTVALNEVGPINGVIFFGSNQATEDAVVTDANAGAFMGMMIKDGGSISCQSTSIIPGQGQKSLSTVPILMQAAYNTVDYQASAVSLGSDEFTVNFSVVPGGTRRVHYLAWGDFESIKPLRIANASVSTTVGFRVKSMFQIGTQWNTTGDWQSGSGEIFAWFGGGSYGINSSDWSNVSATTIRWPPFGQGIQVQQHTRNSGPLSSYFGNFAAGPFLSVASGYAYPTNPTDFYISNSVALDTNALYALWDGDSDTGMNVPSSLFDGTTVANLVADVNPDAVIMFTISGNDSGFSTAANNSGIGFGVKTADYQACVVVNNTGNYLFQSRSKAWASNVGAAGVNAGITELGESDFTMTTKDTGVGAATMTWIAFTDDDPWIPQIYRVQYT